MFTEECFYVSALRRHLNLMEVKGKPHTLHSIPDLSSHLLSSSYACIYTESKDLQSRKTNGVIWVVHTGSHPCFDKVQFNLRLNLIFIGHWGTVTWQWTGETQIDKDFTNQSKGKQLTYFKKITFRTSLSWTKYYKTTILALPFMH